MHTPLNRPVVLTLAKVNSSRRVISASQMQEVEQIAATAVDASQRIKQAEAECRAGLDRMAYQAWQRGFARGHTEALQKVRDYLGALDARRKAVDSDLIALVNEAVCRIIRTMPPGLLTENLIETALSEAQADHGRLVLRVHPNRVAYAEKFLAQASAPSNSMHVVIEADATMAPDDCTLDTPAGTIDASLQTQLDALREVLDEAAKAMIGSAPAEASPQRQ